MADKQCHSECNVRHQGTRTDKRSGRTWRRRRKKYRQNKLSRLEQIQYLSLLRWTNERFNCKVNHLKLTYFHDTGRGLMTLKRLNPGDNIISLPQTALITTKTVLSSTVGQYIKRYTGQLTGHEALTVFLIYERHLGTASDYAPYINILPSDFTTPAYFSQEDLHYLPCNAQEKVEEHLEKYQSAFKTVGKFFAEVLPQIPGILTEESFRWSWYAVNSRSVYHPSEIIPDYKFKQRDNLALAPLLDLLNHSPQARVKAGVSSCNKHYEIITFDSYKRYDQVFICYGAHDNTNLLMEYGFTLPDNPNNIFVFNRKLIQSVLKKADVHHLPQKFLHVKELDLIILSASMEGFSWKLLTFFRLMAMTWEELQNWKTILGGEPVSESNEEMVKRMLKDLLNLAVNMDKSQEFPSVLNPHQSLAVSLHHDNMQILQRCQREVDTDIR